MSLYFGRHPFLLLGRGDASSVLVRSSAAAPFCSSVDAIEAYGNRDRKGRLGRLDRVTGDVYVVLNMASIIVAGADPNRVSAEPPAALQTAYVISKL